MNRGKRISAAYRERIAGQRGARRGVGGRRRVWLAGLVLSLGLGSWAAAAVQFDVASTVACRDVTAEAYASVHPQYRLVEASVRVSALADEDGDVGETQYLYQFIGPTGSMQVEDYEPKTELSSNFAGNIGVETKRESSKSLGLNVNAMLNELVRGSAVADLGAKNAATIRYELKPPQIAVLAAGTIQRGTGVSFQIRGSAESLLDGARHFKLIFRVPQVWRGDVLFVRCTAFNPTDKHRAASSTARFLVGLYQETDTEAWRAAEQLVRTEGAVRQTAWQYEQAIERNAFPTVMHRFGAKLDLVSSKLPPQWLDRLVFGGRDVDHLPFAQYLPEPVVDVARQYAQARHRMVALSGRDRALALVVSDDTTFAAAH